MKAAWDAGIKYVKTVPVMDDEGEYSGLKLIRVAAFLIVLVSIASFTWDGSLDERGEKGDKVKSLE